MRLETSSDAGGTGRRILYSSEGDLTPPPEPTTTCLGTWKVRPVDMDKYVDDNLQEEAISFENVAANHESVKNKHAVASQNVLSHIVRRAEAKGMKVNAGKTTMICISDSLNFKIKSHIYYCLLYTSPSPRDQRGSRMPSSA